MNAYEQIRAALESAREYIASDLASERGAFEGHEGVSRIDEIKADLAENALALAALAELEKAASAIAAAPPVLVPHPEICGCQTRPTHYVGETPCPNNPPVPAVDVSDAMCERVSYAFAHQDYSGSEITPMDRRKSDALLYLRLWQTELGPALGLVNASAEHERICAAIKATDDAASACDYMLDSDDCIAVVRGELGPSNYVREVMGGGK